jgi:hypothetical protein
MVGDAEPGHEVERFLLDRSRFEAWAVASATDGLVDQRWSVVDLWPQQQGPQQQGSQQIEQQQEVFGKAMLVRQPVAGARGHSC